MLFNITGIYLYVINCVIYNEGIKMQEDFRKQIKNEIRKWSMFHSSKKFNQLGDFHYFVDPSN